MSIVDYKEYKVVSSENPSFNALIMAAMAKADTENLYKLIEAFPDTWKELCARYNAPGGALNAEDIKWVEQLRAERVEE